MEPKSAPQSFEQAPTPMEVPRQAGHEQLAETAPEQYVVSPEAAKERQPSAPPTATVVPTTQLPTPVQPQASADSSSATGLSDDNPAVANDDDVIEKEWVDKVKKVINETRSDPHRQEREVGKLQVDYLKKRYGKEIGSS